MADPRTLASERFAAMSTVDAHEVAERLWVGSYPESPVAKEMFGAIVLCASDLQSLPYATDHVELLRCALEDDDGISAAQIAEANRVADAINALRARGVKVLVTCQAGVNRSAFVAGLACVKDGGDPATVIDGIRKRRRPPIGLRPLFNKTFVAILMRGAA